MAENNHKSYENMPRIGQVGGGRQRFGPTAKPKNTKRTLIRLLKI